MKTRVLKCLGKELATAVETHPAWGEAEELRLRADMPPMLHSFGQEYIIDAVVSRSEIGRIALSLSERSLHTFTDEIKNGYFTIEGGLRIGVAGRVVSEGGRICMIRGFSSLNIRFPREWGQISRPIMPFLQTQGDLNSTLIVSAPAHGKTTLLRDIVRSVSFGEAGNPKKCCVIDERGEILPQGFTRGPRTDVLELCPKCPGFMMALRTLSPQVIATDEIGHEEELAALGETANCGVTVLATAQAAGTRHVAGEEHRHRQLEITAQLLQ